MTAIAIPAADAPAALLAGLWRDAGGDPGAPARVEFLDDGPVLPSVFRVSDAASVSVAATGLAAAEIWRLRTGREQTVTVSARHAEVAYRSERYLRIDGEPVPHRNPLWGYYRTGDGRWVQIHTSFPHHLRGAMALLGCERAPEEAQRRIERWEGQALEDAMAERGLVASLMRTREEWLAHPQGEAVAGLPLMEIQRIGDAPPEPLPGGPRPLAGVRALDLTRVIAGPVCGRTLAEHGAEVMRVQAAHLPSLPPLVMDTGRGKLSTHLDLREAADRERFERLLAGADVLAQCGEWLQRLGHVDGLERPDPGIEDVRDLLDGTDTPFGRMTFVRPAAALSETPPHWSRPAVPLGTHPPEWP